MLFQSNAEIVTFSNGDIVASAGDEPNGIYVIISGMVRITFVPTRAVMRVIKHD